MKAKLALPATVLGFTLVFLLLPAFADNKEMADLYFNTGMKALEDGKVEKAREQFEKALKRYPCHAGAVVELGRLLTEALDSKALIKLYGDWLKALKSNDNTTQKQLEVSEKLKAELRSFEELDKIDKKYAKKFVTLAKSLRRKDEAAAAEACQKALELDPENSYAAGLYKKIAGSEPPKKLANVKMGNALFSDDFSKPTNMWYQREGYAFYEKEKFFVKSDLEAPFSARYSVDFKPGDFYIESVIQLAGKAKAGTAGGICFRVSASNTFYAFMIAPNGKFGVWLVNKGYKKDLTGKEVGPEIDLTCCIQSKHIKRDKAKNTIAAAFVGSKLFCYVNKHLIFTCEENTFQNGTLGFMVNKGNNIYVYDNFKVYEASLPGK